MSDLKSDALTTWLISQNGEKYRIRTYVILTNSSKCDLKL